LGRSAVYGISTRFALWGQSAGAHLAALYAYKYENAPYKALACIEQVGPTELLSLYDQLTNNDLRNLLRTLVGDPKTQDSLLYKSSSPVEYVKPSSCPTLILHGDADAVVPYRQAEILHRRLDSNGVENIYKLYPGQGHGLEGVTLDALTTLIGFLNKHMK
jgi:dipeptidyl aminopeptidase/acylaminoacyl peptidase